MPPEQRDEAHDRQIDALRRYVADLGVPRDRQAGVTPKPPAPERRPPATVPWLLLTLVLVAAALVGGVLIGQARTTVDQGSAAGPGSAGQTLTTRGGPVSTAECKTAVDRANESLALAVKVRGILRDYTQVMNELENGRITTAEAIKAGRPSEVSGAIESAKFDKALASYTQIVDKCRSREP
jgi:hypothetical protein